MVSEPEDRAPATHILLRVIILTYKSPYIGTRIVQTSGGEVLTDTQ
jgi:hypothetical protein